MNRGYIFIFLATVFFSSMEVALKTVAHDFNPMQLNCTRFLVGGLLLIPFALRGLRQHGARVTAAAWKVSAGAAAHMPVARVVNLTKAIESLKERGYYSVGLDGGGDALVGETGFETDPLVVVLGSEGNGLSRLVREACDSIAGIPMSNMVESLNASVAAGITLYAVARARREAAAAAK